MSARAWRRRKEGQWHGVQSARCRRIQSVLRRRDRRKAGPQ